MATYVVTVAAATKSIQPGWQISETANGRNTFACRLLSLDGAYRPALDDEVLVTEDGTRIFGGLIDRPVESGFGGVGATSAIVHAVSAVDFNIYAFRITLTAEIPAGTFKAALTVVAAAGSAQGVTLAVGQVNGPALPALSYQDRFINDVLDELCALASGAGATSYLWEINYSKVLEGWESGTRAAPFALADGDGFVDGDITVEQARSGDYANYVIVLGGTGQADVNDIVGTADGIEDTFALNYTLATAYGYVNVGGSIVGGAIVGGTNETLGGTWTYDATAGTITRTSPPAAGDIIIPYVAQFPLRVFADGGLPAANRVMRTYPEPEVFDATVLQALADSYVVRDMASPKTVRYSAIFSKIGLHPGQTQTMTSAKRNLSGSHLLTDVQILHVQGQLVQRQVTAVSTTRLPATLRQTFHRVFGGGSHASASVGVVTVGTGSVSGSVFLGGSGLDYTQSPTPTWVPGSGGSTTLGTNPFRVRLDTVARGSTLATIRSSLRALTAGVTIQARLYNVTDAVACTGASAVIVTSGYTTFLVTLTAGEKDYELQLLPGSANEDVSHVSFLE